MAFMTPEYTFESFYRSENEYGESTLVPYSVVGDIEEPYDLDMYTEGGHCVSFERIRGWFARLSASGYLDCTEWSGPFDTADEARAYIEELYEVDPDTGDELNEESGES